MYYYRRTSNCKDFVIYDQHLDTDDELFVYSSMMPKRYNTDTLLDDYGKRLLHVCKSAVTLQRMTSAYASV